MTTPQEAAMRKALYALEEATTYTSSPSWSPSMTWDCESAIESLRTALAQQGEQPSVAWGMPDASGNIVDTITELDRVGDMTKWAEQYPIPLYAAAMQSAQPVSANIQTKIVKDISAHEGGKQQLPPLPTTKLDALGCAYCNHPLFLGRKCRNCGKEVK